MCKTGGEGINGMRRIAFGIGNNRFVQHALRERQRERATKRERERERDVSIVVAFVNWLGPIIEIPLKRKIAKLKMERWRDGRMEG